jgi:hypothetical protein
VEGYDEQNEHPRHTIDRQAQELARGQVDPLRVLENHQNGLAPRQSCKLIQQRFEQQLALALRAKWRNSQ